MAVDRVTEVYEGTASSDRHREVVRRRIHWMCSQVSGRRVLDVGCSQGIASLLLAREGKEVVGLDRDLAALEFARDRLLEEDALVRARTEFVFGEAADLPFDDQQFDVVLLGELLEHLVDPVAVLAEARRVLRPGGTVVITTPYGLHDFPDHKEPIYLETLLRQVSPHFKVAKLELVDRYIALTAEARQRAGRAAGTSLWSTALRLAESRLAEQDHKVAAQYRKLEALYAERKKRLGIASPELQEQIEALQAAADRLQASTPVDGDSAAASAALKERTDHVDAPTKQLRDELAELKETKARLADQLETARTDAERAEERERALEQELATTQEQLASRAEQLSNVLESRSYRIVKTLWRMRRMGRRKPVRVQTEAE